MGTLLIQILSCKPENNTAPPPPTCVRSQQRRAKVYLEIEFCQETLSSYRTLVKTSNCISNIESKEAAEIGQP